MTQTIDQWAEAHRTLSRRVTLTEEAQDRQAEAQTLLESRTRDLEQRAVFATKRTVDQQVVILLLPAEQVQAALTAVLTSCSGPLAIEVLG